MSELPETWQDARRVEAWAGELRVNVIRLIAIALFYGRHLVEYFLANPDARVRGVYHARVTFVCAAWFAVALALHIVLTRRRMPWWLSYATVAWDAAMITILCMLTGDARTPLVLLLFVLIATAPLRLDLRLIYFATAAAIVGYLMQLACYAWYVVGYQKYYATPELRIPRSHEAVVVLALLVTGLLAGQSVRQARRLVMRYPVTIAEDQGAGQ
jgi:hypothetical protein